MSSEVLNAPSAPDEAAATIVALHTTRYSPPHGSRMSSEARFPSRALSMTHASLVVVVAICLAICRAVSVAGLPQKPARCGVVMA
jgi:hypothetical protein